MNVIQCTQGSDIWKQIRLSHFTASEAPAMLGVSKYISRSELLRLKHTGVELDVSQAKQRLFDAGHQAEAAARSIAESIIGQDLFPIVGTKEVNGLPLLASFDGVVMDESIVWETKLWNESLAQACAAGELDPHYWAQLEHQLIVSRAKKVLFTTSDGTMERTAQCWYTSVPERREQILKGWEQFAKDLSAYTPPEVIVPAVAAAQLGLPAVSIQVNGSIALVDNLDKFGAALTNYVSRINKKPETDQDFADLEATVKTLKNAEDALDEAENSALAQTESIDVMRRTVALYRETAKTNRLLIEKLVKAEKENRRNAIVSDAAADLVKHINGLNTRFGKPYMPTIASDFPGAVKGLKSIDSMRDKVATELARCKIEANAVADRIQANLAMLSEVKEYAFLFNDRGNLIGKAADDLKLLIQSRIDAHKAAEAAITHSDVVRLMPTSVKQAMAPKPETPPSLRIGEIANRLGFGITAAFLRTLGFEPAGKEGASVLFHESQFPAICNALIDHIQNVVEGVAA